MTIYSLYILLSRFGASLLFHVQFCCFLICIQISQKAGKMVWYSNLSKFSTVCCDPHCQRLLMVNKAEVGIFLEFSCFFYDPTYDGNLISGSSAFSKSILNIWKFTILLKICLQKLLCSMWDECKCVVTEHSLKLPFFGIAMKTTFPVPGPLLSFPNFLTY